MLLRKPRRRKRKKANRRLVIGIERAAIPKVPLATSFRNLGVAKPQPQYNLRAAVEYSRRDM